MRASEFSPQPAPRKGRRRRTARPFEALLVYGLSDAGYSDTAIAGALGWPVSDNGTRRRSYKVERWEKVGADVADGEVPLTSTTGLQKRYQENQKAWSQALRRMLAVASTVSAEHVEDALLAWHSALEDGHLRRDPLVLRLAGREYRTRGVPAKVAMQVLREGSMPASRFVASCLGVPEAHLLADLQREGYGVKALRVTATLLLAAGFCLAAPGRSASGAGRLVLGPPSTA